MEQNWKKVKGRVTTRLVERAGVPFLNFPLLEETGIVTQGFSTRLGGVSEGDYSSMNVSFTRGDREEAVRENYRRLGIRIVNISVGTRSAGDEEESPLVRQVNRLWDAGLVVVVAAGNNGPGEGTVTTPGISRKVITVGSSDDNRVPARSGRPRGYSGRGPTARCIIKPEVTAPGSSILACNVCPNRRPPFYVRKSGTSMSTPIVTGAIALLLEKYPWMSNVDVKLALRESCRKTGAPVTKEGWGTLDIRRLLA